MTMVSWDKLNAYVDNELDAAEAASVASAIAKNPELAAQVASLTQLKATTNLIASKREGPSSLPPPASRVYELGRVALVAASLLIALGLGVGLWRAVAPQQESELALAISAGKVWLSTQQSSDPQTVKVTLPAGTVELLPDLGAAGLRLSYLSSDTKRSSGGGILAGYVGPHGCRLGLWIQRRASRPDAEPAAHDEEGLQIRLWSTDDKAYALLSRGMDPQRFERYAQIISRLTSAGHSVDGDTTVALEEASGIGRACDG